MTNNQALRSACVRHEWLLLALVLALGGCHWSPDVEEVAPPATGFIGSQACQDCHQTQFEAWQGSHHQLAMQVATTDTVIGDFSVAVFDYFETRTEFVTQGGQFVVRTADANGDIRDFPVTHTFGVEPLQQYLVEFPDGRKQALPFAWDTRPDDAGGQRWYHLYPDEYIGPGDPLHWTGRYFNWNYMCAECHSTDVALGYDIDQNSFATTYAEISVGCEACHGPGAMHIDQANENGFDEHYGLPVNLDDRRDTSWLLNSETGMATLSSATGRQQQPESCGRCHARRSVLTEEYEYGKPLLDTHLPSLLEESLYHPDGRILDEVYVYGSFVQSKMYAAGVTCTDCHDPHTSGLRTGADPNSVCAQCHLPARFAADDHSGSAATGCVDCHMKARTYMGVDDRHDHSFRLPDTDRDKAHYGAAIAAGRAGPANPLLLDALGRDDYPAIARATLLTLLTPTAGDAELAAIAAGIHDSDPLVRIGALRALRVFSPQSKLRDGSQLLRDPIRGVRIEAAITYAEVRDLLPLDDARAFPSAADEYRASQLTAASMPESLTVLAEFESQMGNVPAADRYFERSIGLDSGLAVTRHAYGLFLVRTGHPENALQQLRRAAELAPDNPRYIYVLGVALNSMGRHSEALELLEHARNDFQNDFDIAWALATMLRDSGDIAAARSVTEEMLQQFPERDNVRALLDALAAQ